MQLTLVRNDAIHRLHLPEKSSGQYWVTQTNDDGERQNVVSVEGRDADWVLKSNKSASLLDADGHKVREIVVEPNRFYSVVIEATGEKLPLHSEPSTEDRRLFAKYVLPSEGRLVIGRNENTDIRFASRFASSKHAQLSINGGDVSIADLESSNGTFVNCRRVTTSPLRPGDVISIIGLVIVIGRGFIAINNPDGLVTCNQAALKPLARQPIEPAGDEPIEESFAGERFFRSPRFKRDISTAVIKIDSPPQPNNADEMPLMMVLGPAATMGMASLFTGLFALNNVMSTGGKIGQAMPTLVMSFSMVIGMVLWPILSKRYEKKNRIKKEAERQKKYAAYLDKMRDTIEDERKRQSQILCENVVTIEDCVQRIRARERNLWERTIGHNDFMKARLGIGDWPFDADIKYSERKFTIDEDNLQEEMLAIAEDPRLLREVPVSLSLIEQPIVGLIGDRTEAREQLRGIIIQLAALHSYDELKLVFIYDPKEAPFWDFVRLLPHAWNDERSIRFVATDPADVRELGTYLDGEFSRRQTLTTEQDIDDLCPRYVIFALSKDLASKAELINKILKEKRGLGFSLVTLYDELRNLPKECRVVVEIDTELSRIYDKDDITGDYLAFKPDADLQEDARSLAECLANTKLDTAVSAFALPDVVTFLELMGVGKVEHLNSLTRWKDSNPVMSLAAPIGVDSSGETITLDLHERFHGPHGLIAGMTGSGKSELIMTYILSMAVDYHPDEVAFVLIDYKGGGMANAFSNLPHVAGTITNLDGAAVNRSLVSIQSELKHRQAVFNEAGAHTGMSNIDIYKYQSLYREGAVEEPLPHLLIISDEFAELKTQQPEFMTQLVSAARIGRSLGVHLILATQKPSGVVDDQIWSNSRFRICLKVQEQADSMEVIKRPDAASLSATGRFYIQVGFNELFKIGQSAWAGAPYYPAERVEKAYDASVLLINTLGQPVKQAKLDKRKSIVKNPPKQLDEITKYLATLASDEGVKVRPLWLEPIPEMILLDKIRKKHRYSGDRPFVMDPVVGEYDDPARQRQGLVTVPLSTQGNVVLYGSAGNGKTTFLETFVYSLISTHTPAEVNLYLLDFASETMRAFQSAPHVGDVLFAHETEKVHNLLAMLTDEIERRKRLFAEFGGDYGSYLEESGKELESIVVVIHNYAAFGEIYEQEEAVMSFLTREGTKYGIYFVLSAATTAAVRYRILQNFKQLFVLQLNDSTEYSAVLGNTGGVQPSSYKGRGILKTDTVYEFQTAHLVSDGQGELAFIRQFCEASAAEWSGTIAKRVPILPEVVSPSYLAQDIASATRGQAPIGVDKKTLEIVFWDFRKQFLTLVLSRDNDDPGFASALAAVLSAQYGQDTVVLDVDGTFSEDPSCDCTLIRGTQKVDAACLQLFEEMVERNNAAVEARAAGTQAPCVDSRIYIVPSASTMLRSISVDTREKFTAMLDKCDETLGITFVFVDAVGEAATLMFEPWAKRHVSSGKGIWRGDGFTDQFTLQLVSTPGEMYHDIGPAFGYVVEKAKARLVKLLAADPTAVGGAE